MLQSPPQPGKPESLGRLKSLGPAANWQVALLLPRNWDNLSPVLLRWDVETLRQHYAQPVVLRGQLAGPPNIHYRPIPRTQGCISDGQGNELAFTIFGNTKPTAQALNDRAADVCLYGKVDAFNGRPQLSNVEIIDPAWAGRLRPRYPGKPGVIGADLVRKRVTERLAQAAPVAAEFIREQLGQDDDLCINAWLESLTGTNITLESIILAAHTPESIEQGQWSQSVLEQLNALAVILSVRAERAARGTARWRLADSARQSRAAALPFNLNTDQVKSIGEILSDLTAGQPMHRLLTGDVGTGKTAVYGVAAACAADGGARVAVLAPNTGLVAQVAATFQAWWPDLGVLEVTGSGDESKGLADAPFLVGTTALLHRNIGGRDFIVVDEQHKFSRAQREQLRTAGSHLLECTATCTPRSQALLELGINETSRLTERAFERTVETRIWQPPERGELMGRIEATVAAGQQVLVICPERGGQDSQDQSDNESLAVRNRAIHAYDLWRKRFGDRVRLIHGAMTNTEKNAALGALRENAADVLVSTTVVEVGIDLPRLNRVVVIEANRLGLVTLHQIRGRVARQGGTGYCDLVIYPKDADDAPAERLGVLCATDNGFEIAREDLRLRGFGNLSMASDTQKGFESALLFERPLTVAHVEAAVKVLGSGV